MPIKKVSIQCYKRENNAPNQQNLPILKLVCFYKINQTHNAYKFHSVLEAGEEVKTGSARYQP